MKELGLRILGARIGFWEPRIWVFWSNKINVDYFLLDKLDHFCGSINCTGSHGNCTVVNDAAQCQCTDKWKGARCELEKKEIDWLLIALIICGSVLAFVILVNVAILIR